MRGFKHIAAGLTALAILSALPVHAQRDENLRYKVDSSWPKQLPNKWIMGQVGGLAVDSHDHIWVLQRPLSPTRDELVRNKSRRATTAASPRQRCCNSITKAMC